MGGWEDGTFGKLRAPTLRRRVLSDPLSDAHGGLLLANYRNLKADLDFLGQRPYDRSLESRGLMAEINPQILRGTLDLLVLKAVSGAPAHGYEIARWVERATANTLRLEDGSLYPALYRLEERGFIEHDWRLTQDRRRAKYYSLTTAGRQRLREETKIWTRYARAIFDALEAPVPAKPARA